VSIRYCNLSAELTKTHFFRLFIGDFPDWEPTLCPDYEGVEDYVGHVKFDQVVGENFRLNAIR